MPTLEYKIVVNDAGNLQVSGPIDNVLVTVGALELAKQVVYEHKKQQADRLVQPVSMIPNLPGTGN